MGRWQAFLLLYHLVKGFAFVNITKKMNGNLFAQFVENNFPDIFKESCNPSGNVFVQDGDPSQNSKAAKISLEKIGALQFSIPPRSPDLNPIENVFNLVERQLNNDAIRDKISKESYNDFVERVTNTLLNYPVGPIDNIINSMPSRIADVIRNKGQRLRY